jgi:hypothetical protein
MTDWKDWAVGLGVGVLLGILVMAARWIFGLAKAYGQARAARIKAAFDAIRLDEEERERVNREFQEAMAGIRSDLEQIRVDLERAAALERMIGSSRKGKRFLRERARRRTA